VLCGNGGHDGQAQAVARALGAVAHMALLQGLQARAVHARAMVAHGEHAAGADDELHGAAAGVVQRVLHQVAQRNRQRVEVAQGDGPRPGVVQDQVEPVHGHIVLPELLRHRGCQLAQIHGLARKGSTRLGARQLQQLLGAQAQRVQGVDGGLHV